MWMHHIYVNKKEETTYAPVPVSECNLLNNLWNPWNHYLILLQGAATVCYLALHPQVAGVTGSYFVDCNTVQLKSHATDKELAKRLWDFSMSLLRWFIGIKHVSYYFWKEKYVKKLKLQCYVFTDLYQK